MANNDDMPYQPVWVTFDAPTCAVILWREVAGKIDPAIWETWANNRPLVQDQYPITIEGVEYKPTWDWITQITGRRRSDKTCFYVTVRIKDGDIRDGKIELSNFMSTVQKAIEYFNSFSHCECKVGNPCEQHPALSPIERTPVAA